MPIPPVAPVAALEVYSSRKALAFALAAQEARARYAAAAAPAESCSMEAGSTFNAQRAARMVRPTLSLHR